VRKIGIIREIFFIYIYTNLEFAKELEIQNQFTLTLKDSLAWQQKKYSINKMKIKVQKFAEID